MEKCCFHAVEENYIKLDPYNYISEGGGGDATTCKLEETALGNQKEPGTSDDPSKICPVSTAAPEISLDENVNTPPVIRIINTPVITTSIVQPIVSSIVQGTREQPDQINSSKKTITKFIVANPPSSTNTGVQKVVSSPLITVLNPTGPLKVVKTLCVNSGSSNTSQFTLVNSTPLNVKNVIGKSSTITLLNSPVTVVRAINSSQNVNVENNFKEDSNKKNPSVSKIIENRTHNVFVKKTCQEPTILEISQNQKLLTRNSFPQNILSNSQKTINGQRGKLKIVSSNMIIPRTSQTTNNLLVNKSNPRYIARQKLIGPNGTTTKYINKPTTPTYVKPVPKSPPRLVYPTHKNQIKIPSPAQKYVQNYRHCVKSITSNNGIPAQVTRTSSGLRPISPQKVHKVPTQASYVSKHMQPQKVRPIHAKIKGPKLQPNVPYNVHPMDEVTFNQALTAQIIETLNDSGSAAQNNRFHPPPTRHNSAFIYPGITPPSEQYNSLKDKNKSGLNALSLICQAVLLDHNYNASLPPDSPPQPTPPSPNLSSRLKVDADSPPSMNSPVSKKTEIPSTSMIFQSIAPSVSIESAKPPPPLLSGKNYDKSDISDISDQKSGPLGEETDTASEAEAATNETFDYITRCICEFIHDDGYMVQCDNCKVWQHVQCVLKNIQVPDEYLCEECDRTKPVDRQKARDMQQKWLKERELRKDPKKPLFKSKEEIRVSDSSDEDLPSSSFPKTRIFSNKRKGEKTPKLYPLKQKHYKAKEVGKRRQKRKGRKIIRRKLRTLVKNQSDDETHESWSSYLPQLRQWIEKYEEAVTNHYSPELRARVSSIRVNGSHPDQNIQFDSSVNKCRVHTQPLTEIKYLVASVNLVPNTVVIELRGKYMLSAQHRNSGSSLTTRQHAQRPGPFLFFYRLHKDNTEVCVDTRTYGNSARFIRRSCKPNAELKHCIEKGVLHIYVVTTTSVDKNCELTIKHESHDLAAVTTMSIACVCGNPMECTVNKSSVKKNGESSEVPVKRRRRRKIFTSSPSKSDMHKLSKESLSIPSTSRLSPVKIKSEKPVVKVLKENESSIIDTNCKLQTEVADYSDNLEMEKNMKSPSTVCHRKNSVKANKSKETDVSSKEERRDRSKKLSREERKLQAIIKVIEKMEKAETKKQEHQTNKQSRRRNSEPNVARKDEEAAEPKLRRRRRKGSLKSANQSALNRIDRINSSDSYMTTSGEDPFTSPRDPLTQSQFLLTLNNTKDVKNNNIKNLEEKSPNTDLDSNSNSSFETRLASAINGSVEALDHDLKFPKTKKGLLNDWLNKMPTTLESSEKHQDQPPGSAKKRWLMKAIQDDHSCDIHTARPESPPNNIVLTPPKKRRVPKELLLTEKSVDKINEEIKKPEESEEKENSDAQNSELDDILNDRTAKMKEELCKSLGLSPIERPKSDVVPVSMDPRLNRERLLPQIGDMGKSEPKPKIKLSINEYRQRRKQNTDDKEQDTEQVNLEETNFSELLTASPRSRSRSSSSCSSSSSSLSLGDIDPEMVVKVPVFNSEPTELERQRETCCSRFKKGFELTFDKEPPEAIKALLQINVESIKLGSVENPMPQFAANPEPEVRNFEFFSPRDQLSNIESLSTFEPLSDETTENLDSEITETVEDEASKKPDISLNFFYTPDEEIDEAVLSETEESQNCFEEESISYVPPYNNPIYPNCFTTFPSIDDEARYEGRNPSPPPEEFGPW